MDIEEKDNFEETFNSDSEDPIEINEQPGDSSKESVKRVHLSGMYKDWFLDYASYVILERAVPHIDDGLKPVHRRILHSMKRLDDGRYNKVANLIGHTMQFHPHGDASIGAALVQMGQKDLLVDTQGNWGNTLTGDGAAAPRYIEARLSKFANEVVFNPKTTEWKSSYDGRNKEPVTLPVKFPLLLAQGVEGIAVGLASKILPHNFNEIIDAAIAYLNGKDFELFPDFPSGGMADFSRYNDGLRGGNIKIRAKIEKFDRKTLIIREIPYGTTTTSLIESIIRATDKGKIKIKKIDDNTAEFVEIQIQLYPDVSSDKTIDALYAFTDCEISVSPNSCVIQADKPRFLGVNEILRLSVNRTVELLTKELEIRKSELEEGWHFSSLEKIFIEKRIYRDIEECETYEAIIEAIDKGLQPYKKLFKREITRDDIIKLTDIKIKRISKYDSFRADELIKSIEDEILVVDNYLRNIIPYTIDYYKSIKKKFGQGRERKTDIKNFDVIVATKVVVANEKLYVNRKEGFIGTGLKKEEFVSDCSDIDDIIVIRKDGTYLITKVSDKSFVGTDILHVAVFKQNDERTIYNLIYKDGRYGAYYMKRFFVKGITRDKEYNITKGTDNSKIVYLTINPNGEAEVIKIILKPKAKLRRLSFEMDFGDLAIKGRSSLGNILTKYDVHKISLKEKGLSTLGGRKIWFDEDVQRLNSDERGKFLGEFLPEDRILFISKLGYYRVTSFELSNHYSDSYLFIEKFNPDKIITVVHFDGEQSFYYLKRFTIEADDKNMYFINNENSNSKLVMWSDDNNPILEITFGGPHKDKENETIDASEFIAVKGFKARGKRVTTFEVKKFLWLENPDSENEIPEDTETPKDENNINPDEDLDSEMVSIEDDDFEDEENPEINPETDIDEPEANVEIIDKDSDNEKDSVEIEENIIEAKTTENIKETEPTEDIEEIKTNTKSTLKQTKKIKENPKSIKKTSSSKKEKEIIESDSVVSPEDVAFEVEDKRKIIENTEPSPGTKLGKGGQLTLDL